eukprot:255837_1
MYQAQCDANNCLAEGYNGGWIGENLAASGHSNPQWTLDPATGGIGRWFDESTQYHFDSQTSFGVTGHWTQGAWAASRYIGCGYAACSTNSPFSLEQWFNFVCKYYPGGNYGGMDPYETGTECTECGKDRTSCTDSLCAGNQCSACAVDYGQRTCDYNSSTCPAKILRSDGVSVTSVCSPELWDAKSEGALVGGVVGSFFTLIALLGVLGFVVYFGVVKRNENGATYDGSENKILLVLVLCALLLFVLPPISFAFVKGNVVMGNGYNPYDSCKVGW